MNVRFDFIMHWLWAIVWALLALSGFGMVGAKHGWLVNFNYATADFVHRLSAAVFVVLTFVSIAYEVFRNIKKDTKNLAWFVIGRSGYQLFTFITTLILIITGALIWICSEFNMSAVGFALLIHEYISYIALASVIWHIYKKCHALLSLKKPEAKLQKG
ncbi:MAG: cytochrome b/b6 domain-containing protein [Clostridia bacterium]|nr:cytochrome b/b6 domain-containing protein [Clostridia bacterium]